MWWKEVRRHIAQQEAEYDVLFKASEEEISKLKRQHEAEVKRLTTGLKQAEAEQANLRSINERLSTEVAETEKRLAEQDIVTRNLADEVLALRNANRDLRARNSTLFAQNAKMKKQIDALPQRDKNGRFIKNKQTSPELKMEDKGGVEVKKK